MAHVAARVVYVDAVDVAVLTHVVRLAHTLGLSVTAEPVETAAQLRQLQALGCDVGQGWYFSAATDPGTISAMPRAQMAAIPRDCAATVDQR
ncbi:MAG: EAL domain-containing protein [Pseudonocardia sp.]|nr:EAL domain-containing protein [Pseudonocardia sp.]